jgi:geranylgeranyl diphosphate synthase, type II
MQTSPLTTYLDECRALVLAEIKEIVPDNRYRPILYNLILDYPLRPAKAVRPALCIATCRAMGGRVQDVLRSAAVIELFHNAFLVHDDIEDGSHLRRGRPTLHAEYGLPIAINVGDAIFALCLQPLLDNMQLVGMGKALRVLQLIATMTRESVEGQAMELDWVRHNRWHLRDRDYYLMCYKKTCWYTFIAPMQIGATLAGVSPSQLASLRKYGAYVGVAFQIRDDVLNLSANEKKYGKEIAGDLWEGKHTLILLHMMRQATPGERQRAQLILGRERHEKSESDICYLLELIERYGSITYADQVACQLAAKAEAVFAQTAAWLPPSIHRDFLWHMARHVTQREQ